MDRERDLSASFSRLGNIAQSQGDLPGAKGHYEKGLQIGEELAERTHAAQSWDYLAESYYKLATVSPEQREAYLQKAIGIYEALCRAYPGVARYKNNLAYLRSLWAWSP